MEFTPGFNPCFNGFSIETQEIKILVEEREKASILVLMDFPLKPSHDEGGDKTMMMLQSLF